MSEKDLYWKCKEEVNAKFPAWNRFGCEEFSSWLHCHHEPREKEICQCQKYRFDAISAYATMKDNLSCTNLQIAIPANFCPECGRKL
jgi:hypothetical protein